MQFITNLLTKLMSLYGLTAYLSIVGNWNLFHMQAKTVAINEIEISVSCIFKKQDNDEGDVSSFQALCTALSSTIGTGNIVGVATAIAAGGPGALFWMWVSAFFGMATKYAEGLLAIRYRIKDENNQMAVGPMYYLGTGFRK